MRRSEGAEDAAPEVRSTLPATGVWCAIACAVLAAVGGLSLPLVHWFQHAAGWRPTVPQETAWFTAADSVARGVQLGTPAPVGIGIALGQRSSARYTVRSSGELVESGTLTGAGTTHFLNIPTSAFVPGWVTITVQGLFVPLKFWVHT